ncbi:MAG: ATP-binding protein [Candidatus Portiera sp.]|nr:ATP-binding protein [Portiera sp.]
MDFQLDIKISNLGKIKNVDLSINRATIFAGLNSTGKSYVSKFLYSLLDSFNVDLKVAYLQRMDKKLIKCLSEITFPKTIYKKSDKGTLGFALEHFDLMFNINGRRDNFSSEIQLVSEETRGNDDKVEKLVKKHIVKTKKSLRIIEELFGELEITKHMVKSEVAKHNKQIKGLKKTIEKMEKICDKMMSFEDFYNDQENIKKTYEVRLAHNLTHNFQVRKLTKLIGAKKKENAIVELSIANGGKNKIKCQIKPDGSVTLDYDGKVSPLTYIQKFSRVIYLESPIYSKLEKPVSRRISSRFITDDAEDILSGVPEYFFDLLDVMYLDRAGNSKIKLNLEKIVDGKIFRDDRNVLVYQEKSTKEVYPLTATSTGIIQLAFLAYLVESQVITKDAVVFMDEPEAHLHPNWQQVMMESLFSLVAQGVNVVIATHSPHNIQWLEAEMSEDDELEEHVSLNHFQKNGIIKKNKSTNSACNKVLMELTEEFANQYLRSL